MIKEHKRLKIKDKERYKNYYLIEVVIIISLFFGLYPFLRIKEADMNSIKKDLEQIVNLDLAYSGDENALKKIYYINKSYVEDFVLYAPKSNMDVEEILVLKAKENIDISEVESKVNERLSKQKDSFSNYNPEKEQILDKYILEKEGQYLIFVVSEKSSEIYKIIKDNFK